MHTTGTTGFYTTGTTGTTGSSDPFENAYSWIAYNASNIGGLDTTGYSGVVSDGRYLYYIPWANDQYVNHGVVLRYNTQSFGFTNALSWDSYDASNTNGMVCQGFIAGVFDGKYLYFISATAALILRYNTQQSFTDSQSWTAYNANRTGGLIYNSFAMAIYQNPYLYFSAGFAPSAILRYNTLRNFTDPVSWSGFNWTTALSAYDQQLFGVVTDGLNIYFTSISGGTFLKYSTAGNFVNASSWSTFHIDAFDQLSPSSPYTGKDTNSTPIQRM